MIPTLHSNFLSLRRRFVIFILTLCFESRLTCLIHHPFILYPFFIHPFVHLPTHPPICLSIIHPFTHPLTSLSSHSSIHSSIHPFLYSPIQPPSIINPSSIIHPFIHLFIHSSIYLSNHPSILHLAIHLSILSIQLSVFPCITYQSIILSISSHSIIHINTIYSFINLFISCNTYIPMFTCLPLQFFIEQVSIHLPICPFIHIYIHTFIHTVNHLSKCLNTHKILRKTFSQPSINLEHSNHSKQVNYYYLYVYPPICISTCPATQPVSYLFIL